jgi:hypothetical protein
MNNKQQHLFSMIINSYDNKSPYYRNDCELLKQSILKRSDEQLQDGIKRWENISRRHGFKNVMVYC